VRCSRRKERHTDRQHSGMRLGSKLMSMPALRHALFGIVFWAGVLLLLAPTDAVAQQFTKRLILKDGSYQSVVKYEIQGDRVHYLSAERYEWEDIPKSLVDWDATNKYEAELSSGKLPKRRLEETPEEKEEREKEAANSPEISPGLRLPGTGGVFLFDQYQGKPELAEIIQNGSELNKSRKKSVLRASINPLASARQNLELKGEHAQVQSHQPRPVIYIDIDEGPSDTALGDRFRLVRADSKNGVRVIGNLKVAISGKVSQQATVVPATVEKVGTGQWLRLTPAADLVGGEYAIIEMLGTEEMNSYVWDFGVNPSAAQNPNTWQPAAPAEADKQPGADRQ